MKIGDGVIITHAVVDLSSFGKVYTLYTFGIDQLSGSFGNIQMIRKVVYPM